MSVNNSNMPPSSYKSFPPTIITDEQMDGYVFRIYLRFLDCVSDLLSIDINPFSDETKKIVDRVKDLFSRYQEFGFLRDRFEKFLRENNTNTLYINPKFVLLYKEDAYNVLKTYNNKDGLNKFLNNLKLQHLSDVDKYILCVMFVVDMILLNKYMKDEKYNHFIIPKVVYELCI